MKVNKTSAPVHDDYYSNGITFGTPSFLTQHSNNDSPYSPTNESDRKRHELRQALANRLRFDLVQQEEEKEFKQQYDRFSTFDKHLKATESYAKQQKDQENAAKEVLEKQQTSLAKSIQNSKII